MKSNLTFHWDGRIRPREPWWAPQCHLVIRPWFNRAMADIDEHTIRITTPLIELSSVVTITPWSRSSLVSTTPWSVVSVGWHIASAGSSGATRAGVVVLLYRVASTRPLVILVLVSWGWLLACESATSEIKACYFESNKHEYECWHDEHPCGRLIQLLLHTNPQIIVFILLGTKGHRIITRDQIRAIWQIFWAHHTLALCIYLTAIADSLAAIADILGATKSIRAALRVALTIRNTLLRTSLE